MDLIYFIHNRSLPRDAIASARIPFDELTVVFDGGLTYFVNGKETELRPGDVICIPENSFRSRKALANCDYISFNFNKRPEDGVPDLPVRISGGLTGEIRLLLSACDEIRDRMTEDADRLSLILLCILRQLAVNLSTSRFGPLTMCIKNYVAEHLHAPITLHDIGKATFFSPAYCSSVFRRETGVSIIDYAIDEKMKEAKKLIIEGAPLRRVAEMLGFSDYNYFSRTFKKRFAYSPQQFRNSLV